MSFALHCNIIIFHSEVEIFLIASIDHMKCWQIEMYQ